MNPVIESNHPDPGVVKLGDGTFVVITTADRPFNGTAGAFPILTSPDLYTWTDQGFVFPKGE